LGIVISPNPIKAVLFKQYLQKNDNIKIYNLTGDVVKKELVGNEGVYLVQENLNKVMQKIIVLK
jgi:hypothetical protein